MNDKLVPVAAQLDPIEANLAKVHLEENGIETFLYGEESVGVLPPLSLTGRGVQVMVREADLARATELLAEHRKSS